MDIRETCTCGATFAIDTEARTKIDNTVKEALADWRAGHTHESNDGGRVRVKPAAASSTF